MPGIALFYTLNGFCEGMNNTKVPMIISAIILLINIPVNYVLIYGKFGFPEMGAVGCGYDKLGVLANVGMLYSYIKGHHHYKTIISFADAKPKAKEMLHLLRLGLLIGMNIAVWQYSV